MNGFLKDKNGNEKFILGMQAHNSSTGTFMMQRTIRAAELFGANTLEVPVYWYKIAPQKDIYDMTQVRELIDTVRKTGKNLVLL